MIRKVGFIQRPRGMYGRVISRSHRILFVFLKDHCAKTNEEQCRQERMPPWVCMVAQKGRQWRWMERCNGVKQHRPGWLFRLKWWQSGEGWNPCARADLTDTELWGERLRLDRADVRAASCVACKVEQCLSPGRALGLALFWGRFVSVGFTFSRMEVNSQLTVAWTNRDPFTPVQEVRGPWPWHSSSGSMTSEGSSLWLVLAFSSWFLPVIARWLLLLQLPYLLKERVKKKGMKSVVGNTGFPRNPLRCLLASHWSELGQMATPHWHIAALIKWWFWEQEMEEVELLSAEWPSSLHQVLKWGRSRKSLRNEGV